MFESMTYKQRTDAARSTVLIESVVALVQIVIAMVEDSPGNWFAAMFAIAMGTIAWVLLTPEEEE